MIGLARSRHPGIDFRVDSISRLESVPDRTIDLVVSDDLLMDTPDLEAAATSLHRILVPVGAACSSSRTPASPRAAAPRIPTGPRPPGGSLPASTGDDGWIRPGATSGPSSSGSTAPLRLLGAFRAAGFAVEAFEEPRVRPRDLPRAESEDVARKLSTRPYSVAFGLRKPAGSS